MDCLEIDWSWGFLGRLFGTVDMGGLGSGFLGYKGREGWREVGMEGHWE